ncbi:polysaccharide deacetylase family protein [Fulvivirga ligni]|uniref:polysaccharide deacetylase family protein n=1 Tax=Fulvivirga ligni TaxID=2904246 RepID=UPI001F445C63|nr:polysaccharide deacetylase family protein [Fulvivirga ligni]UII22310.1 polysaccharide deacetylase family protein [Fulvivirga ligni]
MGYKSVYLTIDDCPSKDFVNKLHFLMEYKIPAVFFCTASQIEHYQPDLALAIKNKYHIGSHAFYHKSFSSLSLSQCINEIIRADSVIHSLYNSCNISSYPKLFRFPYGDKGDYKFGKHFLPFEKAYHHGLRRKCLWHQLFGLKKLRERQIEGEQRSIEIQRALKDLGYQAPAIQIEHPFYKKFLGYHDWMWTLDIGDYKYRSGEDMDGFQKNIFQCIDSGLPRVEFGLQANDICYPESSNILLMHDYENHSEIFYETIHYFIRQGFTFKCPVTG